MSEGKNKAGFLVTKLVMFGVFGGLVLIPLISMLSNISASSIQTVFSSSMIGEIIGNSILATALATVITIVIAYFLAVCMERVDIRLRPLFSIILILPMLIPSISHGMGLVILFGNNGIITNLLHLHSNIYGLQGIVMGSVLYAYPIAFLMFSDVMRYEDSSPYEAAEVLGIPKWRQKLSITLPYLRKPLISVVFATFTMIITDYGVPLMVGGKFKTLAVVMYQEVIGLLKFDTGSVYGAILLIPAIIAFLVDLYNRDKGNANFVIKPFERSKKISTRVVSYLYCGIVSLLTLLPIVSFIVLGFTKKYPSNMAFSWQNVTRVIALNGDQYLFNSIVIALLVSIVGSLIGFVTAYLTARTHTFLSKALHLVAMTAMAVPGIVLGLSYVLLYKGSFIYGTIIILVMVNIIHFIASPYLMMYNSFYKANENLEAVGDTLGIGRLRLIKDVFLPHAWSTLAEMFTYFFVNSMMTISAVSFLATTSTKPISLMINQFEAQAQLENAAIVSLVILLVNLIVKGVISLIKTKANHFQKA